MRELVQQVQTARKAAGLQVDDRIVLNIVSDAAEVQQALNEHKTVIIEETLAVSLGEANASHYSVEAVVDGFAVSISLSKA